MATARRRGGGGGGGDANIHEQVGASMAFMTAKFGMGCSMGPAAAERMKRVIQSSDCDGRGFMAMLDNMGSDSDSDDSVEMEGFGPLHEAAIAGKMDTCKHLVERLGLDVNAQATGELGLTPLACAVSHGKAIAVRFFLDKGANPDKQDNIGFTPLHYAVKEGHDGLARLLLSRGASVDVSSSEGTPLHLAATSGKAGIMQILLAHNADPNKVSADLETPLTATLNYAADKINESGAVKCMKLLVKAGADLNCTIPDTPLVIATCKGLKECVEYLLEAGADANIPINHDGKMPIEIAAKSARRKLVEILFPFTKPIRGVSNWSVEGLIAHTKSRNPKDKAKVTEKDRKAQLKSLGAKAVERNDYAGASKFYSEAINVDPVDAALYSNRSLCHVKCGEARDALVDADACIRLRPQWGKGYYRKGIALMLLKDYKEACDAFMDGVKKDPAVVEMHEAFWEAAAALKKEHLAGKSVKSFD